MRKILCISLMLFVTLSFGFDYARAQNKTEEALFVEFYIPDEPNGKVFQDSPHTLIVTNDHDFEEQLVGGGFATTHCTNCILTSSYFLYIYEAEKIENNKTKVGFILEFDYKPDCNFQKEITINQSKKETIKLKCGIKVTTYYAPYTPKEQNKRKLKNTPDFSTITPKP